MNNRQAYNTVIAKLKKRKDFNFRVLLESLEYEQGKQDQSRMILLEDILLENEIELANIFQEVRGISVSEIAFNTLTKLPPQVIRDNTMIVDKIFTNAINGKYKVKSHTAINNIRSLLSKTKTGLSNSMLIKSVTDAEIDLLNRTRLAISLTEVDEYGDFFNWETVNLNTTPSLLPAFLFFYAKKNALHAFEKLYEIRQKPGNVIINHLFSPVLLVIKQLLLVDQKQAAYKQIVKKYESAWQNELIFEIIKSDPTLQKILENKTQLTQIAYRVKITDTREIIKMATAFDQDKVKKKLSASIRQITGEMSWETERKLN